MDTPRVFVSSTIEDLREVRAEVDKFIRSLGYHPVRWESGTVPHDPVERRGPGGGPVASAISEVKDADIMVVILGKRYGYVPPGGRKSVTEREYESAIENLIPVYAYVESAVLQEYNTYFKLNRNSAATTYVADRGVHEFIERMYGEKEVSVLVHAFNSAAEITNHLRQQWGCLFRIYLKEKRSLALKYQGAAAAFESGGTTPGHVYLELEGNKFVKFSLESIHGQGAGTVTVKDIANCLRVSNDLQTYRQEVRRRFGCDLLIDRALAERAEEGYRKAMATIEGYRKAMSTIEVGEGSGIDFGLGV